MSEAFEKELRQFRPRMTPPDVRERLGDALREPRKAELPSPWADRCLISALTMGMAAALAIAALLTLDTRQPPVTGAAAEVATVQRQTQEYVALLADGREALPSRSGPH